MNRRKDLTQVRKLLQLRSEEGRSDRSVGKLLGVSKTTVKTYYRAFVESGLPLAEALRLCDGDLEDLFGKGGPVESARQRELREELSYMERELGRRGVDKKRLWIEYRERHPEGYGYTQFCHHLKQGLREVESSVYLAHKAGDRLFVDFAGGKLPLTDRATGEVREVEVLVAILPYSGIGYAEAVESQKTALFLGGLERAFEYMEGVPALVVPDNLKSAVTKAHRYEPSLNRTFEEFCLHYGTAAHPTRAASPKDKAHVENMVKIVYKKVFAIIRNETFFELGVLNDRIRELMDALNEAPLTGRPESRRDLFEAGERETLRPLPATRYEVKRYETKKVSKFCFIQLSEDKNYYSVPYTHVGEVVEVVSTAAHVEILHNHRRIAYHVRTTERYQVIPEHLPPKHRPEIMEWSEERILAKGASIGTETAAYLEMLMATRPHPHIAFRACLGILSLGKESKYGPHRLNSACRRAARFKSYGFQSIASILKKGLDRETPPPLQYTLPLHSNIRGNYA